MIHEDGRFDLNESAGCLPLEDVERVVNGLLQPGSPQQVQTLDKSFREIQHSSRGWEVANFLLERPVAQVRFYGALTFHMKLKNQWDTLTNDELTSIYDVIVGHMVKGIGSGEGNLVLQKLSSALAVYSLLPREVHDGSCVEALLCSLIHGKVVQVETVDRAKSQPIPSRAQLLNTNKLVLALWFCRDLVEQTTALITEHASDRTLASALSRTKANLPGIVSLLDYCLNVGGSAIITPVDLHRLRSEALTCFSACALMVQSAWHNDQQALDQLRFLLQPITTGCLTDNCEEAMEVLWNLLSGFGSFLQKSHLDTIRSLLTSPWGIEQTVATFQHSGDGPTPFAKLALAFGDVVVKELVTQPDAPCVLQMLTMMHSFLRCPGYAVIDDKVVVQALDFWNAFIEVVVDADHEQVDVPSPWLLSAKAHIMQVYHELWAKLRVPQPTELAEVDSDTRKEFRQFRADAKDLLLSAYATVKHALTATIAKMCLQHLQLLAWRDLEASLFCLSAIAVTDQQSDDQILASIFGSNLYGALAASDPAIPPTTRRTAVDLLGQYADFFERNTEYLPPALNFLFSSLENAGLAHQAARSINSLCSSCRCSLSSELPSFVHGYNRLLSWPTADQLTKERVIGGIAAVVQALSSHNDQLTWLNTLLDFVQRDIETASRYFMDNKIEEGQVQAMTAMRCLASIGKASQTPSDVPIDVDSNTELGDFWRTGPGTQIHDRICEIILLVLGLFAASFQPLELHGDIIETVCTTFKSGFGEATPGPFVLSAIVIVDFFLNVQLTTPRLEVVLSMTCAFLRSYTNSNSPFIGTEASLLLCHLISLIRGLGDPRNEAEIASGLIEVLIRYLPRYLNVLLETRVDRQLVFDFPLQCLGVPEYLPKRSAAQFWAAVLNLRPSATVSQETLDQVIEHFGPKLAVVLVDQVAGNATRTDLEWFAEPIKALSNRHVHTKMWLEQALTANGIPSRVDQSIRQRFVKQLKLSNSVITTKRVITTFWSQCKGFESTYTP